MNSERTNPDGSGHGTKDDMAVLISPRLRKVVSVLAAAAGLAAVGVAIGGLLPVRNLAVWFVAVAGVALIAAAASLVRGSLLFGVAILALAIGSAAQLFVTEPLWYPELYLPPRSMFEILMYGLIGVQLVVALTIIVQSRSTFSIGTMVSRLGLWRIAVVLLISGAFTVSILNYIRLDIMPRYALQIGAGTVLLLINWISVLAVCASAPARGNLFETLARPWFLAIVTLVASAIVSYFAFERVGHVADEVSYIFQAQIYARGAMWAPALPEAIRPAFEHFQIMTDVDKWFSPLAPGWPAILTLGVLAGAPWLVNPVLGALSVPLVFAIVDKVIDRRTAQIAAVLFATSPWVIAMSASFMTHTPTLFLMLLSWRLLLAASQGSDAPPRVAIAFVAGLAMGALFLVRPLDGLALAAVTGLFILIQIGLPAGLLWGLPFGVGFIAMGALLLVNNAVLTGSLFKLPNTLYFERTWNLEGFSNRLGFGPDVGPPGGFGHMELISPGHSPYEAIINTLNNINTLQTDLFGWGIGSLLFLWFFLLIRLPTRVEGAALFVIMSAMAAYFFYWFSGSYYIGPRYWYAAAAPLALLTASGIITLCARLDGPNIGSFGPRIMAGVLVLCLVVGPIFLSYRSLTRYYHHRGYHDQFRDIAQAADTGTNAPLVIIKAGVGNMGAAYFLNDPFFPSDAPVFAEDLGEVSNAALIAAFPDRPVVYFDSQSLRLQ